MRFPGTRVFLTGGTGFIGGVLARRFVEEGAVVTALARTSSDTKALKALGVHLVEGNVRDPVTLDVRDQDLVVHAAAWVAMGIPRKKRKLFWETNVGGTRNVVEACRRFDVPKLVHLSSIAALPRGAERPGGAATEADFVPEPRTYQSFYARTKTATHRLVLESGLHAVLPMPGVVLGKGGPFEGIFKRFVDGNLPALPKGDGEKGWVHVEDVADGVLLAAERGEGAYLLVDDCVTITELLARLRHSVDAPLPKRRVGVGALTAGAAVVEGLYNLLGKVPPVSREVVAGLREPARYDASKARRELGWKPDLWGRLPEELRALKTPTAKELKERERAAKAAKREEREREKRARRAAKAKR